MYSFSNYHKDGIYILKQLFLYNIKIIRFKNKYNYNKRNYEIFKNSYPSIWSNYKYIYF